MLLVKRFHNLLIMFIMVSLIILIRFWTVNYQLFSFREYDFNPKTYLDSKGCKQPALDLWDSNFENYFKRTSPIVCDKDFDWVCIQNGTASVCKDTLNNRRDVRCDYTFLKRHSDFRTEEVGRVLQTDLKPIVLQSDFFRVKCVDLNNFKWENIMAGVHYDKEIHQRTGWQHLSPRAMKMNVFLWAFDSLSRLTFMRKLPKTYEYLMNRLNAFVLKGYNIVGDGTPQALIPMLTGKTELELPEVRRRMGSRAKYVDVYPFIWKDYQRNGYVTTYAEDMAHIGTFTYRLKGFDQQPTDHYIRTFYLEAEKEYSTHKQFCLRGTPRHKIFMNWILQLFQMYRHKPKFLFGFHSELSHDDFNNVGSLDEDFRDFLNTLYEDNYLDNTILIVMSDHGHRFASFRQTQQGKQEERLPFFSLTFPPWFGEVYPEAYSNIELNEERLTTPFDVYSTLADVLDYNASERLGNIRRRSISLFKEVPVERTCADADIEPHWCTCLDKELLPIGNVIVSKAATILLNWINEYTKFKRHVCAELDLLSIIFAAKYIPTEGLLRYQLSDDPDGFHPKMASHRTSPSVELYEIHFSTHPGAAHYEATIKYHVKEDQFVVRATDISRTNLYGKDAACVEHTHPELNPYCYCK